MTGNDKKMLVLATLVGGGIDTSDATATAGDILTGKTAYVNDEKITGVLVPLDTSDATATAGDILVGKTAYVNGEKLTGTLPDYVPKVNVGLTVPNVPVITEAAV